MDKPEHRGGRNDHCLESAYNAFEQGRATLLSFRWQTQQMIENTGSAAKLYEPTIRQSTDEPKQQKMIGSEMESNDFN
jgi:hypothetical protein